MFWPSCNASRMPQPTCDKERSRSPAPCWNWRAPRPAAKERPWRHGARRRPRLDEIPAHLRSAGRNARAADVAPATTIAAERPGNVGAIDNRRIARLAKLAGAPDDKAAGVDLHVTVGDAVTAGQPLCTVHADSPGELAYAFDYAALNPDIIAVHKS